MQCNTDGVMAAPEGGYLSLLKVTIRRTFIRSGAHIQGKYSNGFQSILIIFFPLLDIYNGDRKRGHEVW